MTWSKTRSKRLSVISTEEQVFQVYLLLADGTWIQMGEDQYMITDAHRVITDEVERIPDLINWPWKIVQTRPISFCFT